MKKYFTKGLKILLWIIGAVLGLFLLLIIAFQIPAIQDYAKNKAVAYLEGKIKTKVSIDNIQIGFPKDVVLTGIYLEDQKRDTLLAGTKIGVNINLFALLNNKVEINSAALEGIVANVNRNSKAAFNFDYIIKAFKSPKKQTTNTPPMEFSLDKVALTKVRIHYHDSVAKNDIQLKLNSLTTRFLTFDLQKMAFEVPKFKADGLQLTYKQAATRILTPPTTKKSTSPEVTLTLGLIDLTNLKLEYRHYNANVITNLAAEKLLIRVNAFDLKKNRIDLNKIELSHAIGALSLGKKTTVTGNSPSVPYQNNKNWEIKVNDVAFDDVNLDFNNNKAKRTSKGIDYSHLKVQHLLLNAHSIAYNSETISGKINAFSAEEQSGLKVESLKTNFFYGTHSAYLKNLYLKTPQTLLRDEIVILYPSLALLSKKPGALTIKAKLNQSRIGFKEVLLFAPQLSKTNPFRDHPNAVLLVNTAISGKLDNLNIPKLQVSGIGHTKINASGRIIGLPDTQQAYFDLNLKNVQSTAKDVYAFLPKKTIPDNIQLPATFSAKGSFKGTLTNFSTNIVLASSSGNAKVKGTLDRRIKNREKYNLDATLDQFDLGRLLKNDSIGTISATAKIKGSGFQPKYAHARVEAAVLNADFNHYTYKNLLVNGKINKSIFNATAVLKDPNLTFNLVSSGSFRNKYPTGTIHLNVDIADLNKLHLHAGPLKLRGVFDGDIQSAHIDYLNGKVVVHNMVIANEKEQFGIDSITAVAVSTAEKNSIVLNSQFLDAEFTGKYHLSTLVNSVKQSISNYYHLKSNSKNVPYGKQQLSFKVDVKSTPLFVKVIPNLKSLEPMSVTGRYNSVNDTLIVNGSIPRLVYGENVITNGIIKVDKKDNALVYSLSVDEVKNNQIQLYRTSLSGQLADDVADYALLVKDYKNKDRYLIAGNLKSGPGNDDIVIDPKKLMLNYDPWNIAADNRIRFSDSGIYFNNFELRKDNNIIRLQSQSQGSNPPLALEFTDFELKTLTNIVQIKKMEMDGKMNGNALLKNLQSKVLFTADVKVEHFTFKKDTVGDITIKVNNEIANTYNAHIALSGQENQVNLDGNYKTIDNSLNMDLNLQKLNVKSVQGFSMENVKDGTGYLSGKFRITGSTNNPKLLGTLQFNEVGFKATKLNAKFKSMNDKMVFSENAVFLDNFTIKDEKNNDLTLNGKIINEDYSNPAFDLTVDADNFKAVNSKAKDNDTFYGELYLDNHLKVKGTLESPKIEGIVRINKDTKFTIVLPQHDPAIADRQGIVEFIDQDRPQLITLTEDDTLDQTEIKGIDASVNIEIDKAAILSLVIDKANGDYLKLKGDAQLTGGIDPSGKTTLVGRYELSAGSYEMSFNLIKRKFDIKEGSYILWTGEPKTAEVRITAVYKIQTSPIDLLNSQLSSLTPEERNTYKQKISFETELKMNGDLMKPNISFNIIQPEGNNSVSTEIINRTNEKLAELRQAPDEMNKQVFALLLLGRFISEDPFSSESGGTNASSLARESASKILSQQLTNLAGDMIKDFELNFDLNSTEDYTTGQKENKTDLNVGLSKKLLNDRLKVTVGSTFGIEGPEQKNKDTNNIAGDLSAEYQLSKDGRYKLRAYRKNLYQVALQGQVIETGVGFIITMDYNKFSELFHSKKKTNTLQAIKKQGETEQRKTKSNE